MNPGWWVLFARKKGRGPAATALLLLLCCGCKAEGLWKHSPVWKEIVELLSCISFLMSLVLLFLFCFIWHMEHLVRPGMIAPGTGLGIVVAVANIQHLFLALPAMEDPRCVPPAFAPLYCFLPSEHQGRLLFCFYNFKGSQYFETFLRAILILLQVAIFFPLTFLRSSWRSCKKNPALLPQVKGLLM